MNKTETMAGWYLSWQDYLKTPNTPAKLSLPAQAALSVLTGQWSLRFDKLAQFDGGNMLACEDCKARLGRENPPAHNPGCALYKQADQVLRHVQYDSRYQSPLTMLLAAEENING
jgi:hypothetical protein